MHPRARRRKRIDSVLAQEKGEGNGNNENNCLLDGGEEVGYKTSVLGLKKGEEKHVTQGMRKGKI